MVIFAVICDFWNVYEIMSLLLHVPQNLVITSALPCSCPRGAWGHWAGDLLPEGCMEEQNLENCVGLYGFFFVPHPPPPTLLVVQFSFQLCCLHATTFWQVRGERRRQPAGRRGTPVAIRRRWGLHQALEVTWQEGWASAGVGRAEDGVLLPSMEGQWSCW